MKPKTRLAPGFSLLILSLLVLAFQNCNRFSTDPMKALALASIGATPVGDRELVPSTDQKDPSCWTNPAYDSCVVLQNPVVAAGNTLTVTSVHTLQNELTGLATYGVKLTSLSGTGFLENNSLSVASKIYGPMPTNLANLKSPPSSTSSNFEQVNVYYWLTRTTEYFQQRTSALPAFNKSLKVIVDDSINGYEPKTNTLHLKKSDTSALSWNPDLVIHLFGVANTYLANPSGWNTLSNSTHLRCSTTDQGCCATLIGCANAIRFGTGEYFAAVMNPGLTKIGTGYLNQQVAVAFPGVSRDLNLIKTLSAAIVYNSSQGDIHSMGLLWASLWLDIRAKSVSVSPSGTQDIDKLYFELLTLLNGSDTFSSAFLKAKSIDQRLFNSQYESLINAQTSARGY